MSDRTLMMALMSSATTVSLLAVGSTASAEDAAYTLPKMTVTAATRTERMVERTPASTQVISGEAVRRSGATMLDEVLQAESSFFTGPDGNAFSIRGGGRADIIYLIDGRRVAGTSGRGGELNRLPVSYIERIEIVKGPGSVVYGADALAGVINIITRRPKPGFEGGVEAQVGVPTHADGGQRRHGALYLGGGTQDTQVRLFADVMERDAYHERATGNVDTKPSIDVATYDFDQDHRQQADVYNLRAGVNHWLTDTLQVEIEGGWMQEERQTRFLHDKPFVPTGLEKSGKTVKAGSFPARRSEDSGRRDLAATADWFVTDALELRYQIYESRFKLDRSNAFLDPVGFGFASAAESEFGLREVTFTDRVNDLLATWRPGASHVVLAGFEHKKQIYQDHEPEAEPRFSQWVGGTFLQHEWQVTDRLDLVYGARRDETSAEMNNTSLQAGGVYRFAPHARLRLQYAEGFKLPELRSFHVDTRNPRGIRVLGASVVDEAVGKERHELDPERSRNVEMGLSGDVSLTGTTAARYDIGLFYTEYEDRIAKVRGSGDYLTFKNVDSARAQGVDVDLGATFDPDLELRLSATYLDAIDRGTRETLTEAPKWIVVAKAVWTPYKSLELQLRSRYVDEIYLGQDVWDDAYTLTGLDVQYAPDTWGGVVLHGGIDNLFNQDNRSSLYADPGRFVRVGVRYDFE